MTITKDVAMRLWKDVFGNKVWARDCYGLWMYRDDYGDRETRRIRPDGNGKLYHYGWNIDHIRPKSNFKNESDSDFYNNFEPVHYLNNEEKGYDYPSFEIEGKKYQVVKCDICGRNGVPGYGIKSIETGQRIDWKAIQGKYYP